MKKHTIAAVQTAPVFLNREATVQKACSFIREAANNGAELVAFPEVFIPAYPYWAWLYTPLESSKWFTQLYHQSVTVPGPETDILCKCAKEHSIAVVIGVNEIDPLLHGTIYNTNVIIDERGRLVGKHRKLVPTYAEKLVWGNGDGSTYQVHETKVGRVGTLNCGENTHTLARYALLAQGEQIHVANFPAFPFTGWYKETEAIKIRCQAHAFEGKIFVVSSSSLMDEDAIQQVCGDTDKRKLLEGKDFAAYRDYLGPEYGQYLLAIRS
ncbi:UNVERIFIED_CONTAM: hypothetical protein GTU68_043174 [Idotea baltica]|nr:hypothetical protein [Idotea baltica]